MSPNSPQAQLRTRPHTSRSSHGSPRLPARSASCTAPLPGTHLRPQSQASASALHLARVGAADSRPARVSPQLLRPHRRSRAAKSSPGAPPSRVH
ncbi:hypothetical protein NDU88_006200 [Pleurodeles waltl]|uniref:Uncharacterized protein n=1 Tax=Pleurodeles waltl TaxID=8319 RepID=A0AAV7N7Z6_PLEWA|nr:hypothetical protein NDU88_006200 [Pleurodeles waltl]